MADNTLGETDFLWSSAVFRFSVVFGLVVTWPIIILFLDAWIQTYGLPESLGALLRLFSLWFITIIMSYLITSMDLVCDGETKDFNYWFLTILGIATFPVIIYNGFPIFLNMVETVWNVIVMTFLTIKIVLLYIVMLPF